MKLSKGMGSSETFCAEALGWIILGSLLWFYINACFCTVFLGRRELLPANGDEEIREVRCEFRSVRTYMGIRLRLARTFPPVRIALKLDQGYPPVCSISYSVFQYVLRFALAT